MEMTLNRIMKALFDSAALRPVGWIMALGVLAVGCVSVGPFPEVDLDSADWTVWTGQGVWRRGEDDPTLAGEVVLARQAGGDVLVSFSKPPLPVFTARTFGRLWKIEFVERGRSYQGLGRPPSRFVWFAIPSVIDGAPLPKGWSWRTRNTNELAIENRRTGESILLVLD